MEHLQFLDRIIDIGIDAVKLDYTEEDDKDRREGSIAGFEACRGKDRDGIIEVYREAQEYAGKASVDQVSNYWWFQCYRLEVEWVLNVISARDLLLHNIPPYLSYHSTANAYTMVVRILNES